MLAFLVQCFYILCVPACVCMCVCVCVCVRTVQYHLKFAYHDTIVKVSRYTLGIDTSNEYMIYDNQVIEYLKFGTFYVKM